MTYLTFTRGIQTDYVWKCPIPELVLVESWAHASFIIVWQQASNSGANIFLTIKMMPLQGEIEEKCDKMQKPIIQVAHVYTEVADYLVLTT